MRMKYFVRFLSLCLGVLLFHSCLQEENDLSPTPTGISQSPAVLKARAAFEDYASQDIDYQISGLHPGCISPKWEEVKVFSQPEEATIGFDVPLVTEATYEGSFYVDIDTSAIRTDTYRTALLQKLVIAQSLEEDVYGLYIATIIPDAEHATLNREKIASMFYGGDLDTRFSGTVMYSTVTTNLTVQVERYRNGKLCDIVSLFDKELDYLAKLKAMKQLIGAKSLKRTVRTLTRSGEMSGGMLPPVFVEPTNPTPSVPSLPPPPNPPYPELPPGSSTIPPIQPPGKGSGNYNGGNNSGGTNSQSNKTPVKYKAENGDKLIKKNLKVTMKKQLPNTCVTSSMEYINNNIFGDDANQGEYDLYALQMFKINIYKDGIVGFDQVKELVSNFFDTTTFSDYKTVINKGYVIMTDIPSSIPNSTHNIIIVGYKANGDLIYMDPEKGYCYSVNQSYIKESYKIVIKGVK